MKYRVYNIFSIIIFLIFSNYVLAESILIKVNSIKTAHDLINRRNSKNSELSDFHNNYNNVEYASQLLKNSDLKKWLIIQNDYQSKKKMVEDLKNFSFIDIIDTIPSRIKNEEYYRYEKIEKWYLNELNLPKNLLSKREEPVKIAVIDDGFRLSHKSLKNYWWTNNKEIENNNLDDDGNGYIDDFSGWDASDDDGDVNLPEGRLTTFYHGTFITGIIVSILEKTFGENASDHFKIIPVKTLSDVAVKTYLKNGYKGLEYAIKNNVDIINCSWSGIQYSEYEKTLLEIARNRGIIVVGAAGNYFTYSKMYPAYHDNVIAVAAIDTNYKKIERSHYGDFVDISAPGMEICAAGVLSDTSFITAKGTSASTAIISGCTAIMLSQITNNNPDKIIYSIKNGAREIESINRRYSGQLGAGNIDVKNSIKILNNFDNHLNHYTDVPEGKISYKKCGLKNYEWLINPKADYYGIKFKLKKLIGKTDNSLLSFYKIDNLEKFSKTELLTVNLSDFPAEYNTPGHPVYIEFHSNKSAKNLSWDLEYSVIPIDSSSLYCDGTRIFEIPEAIISDGSGDDNYTNNCNCRWQINAPKNKQIVINFQEFNTQTKIDYVYLYEGNSTIQKNMIGKFSGSFLPPTLISRSNQVLIWFLTNQNTTNKGWKLNYYFD